jgi:hypothetical protein
MRGRSRIKTIVLCVSLLVNGVFLVFTVLALSQKISSLTFAPGGEASRITAAALASIPESGAVVFNRLEISLAPGEEAGLQFSFIRGGRQINYVTTALYDHTVISLQPTGFGVSIKALAPGETLMQSITPEGIRDIALVRVSE